MSNAINLTPAFAPAPDASPAFPTATPVSDMTPAEQAGYWRHESKKHQRQHRELLAKLTSAASAATALLDALSESHQSEGTSDHD